MCTRTVITRRYICWDFSIHSSFKVIRHKEEASCTCIICKMSTLPASTLTMTLDGQSIHNEMLSSSVYNSPSGYCLPGYQTPPGYSLPGLTSRSRRSSTASMMSEGGWSTMSSVSSCSTTSSEGGLVGVGFIKGLMILAVCMFYAFALFFIASFAKAISYILNTTKKGN